MEPQVLLTSNDGNQYLPFAKNKFYSLDAYRKDLNLGVFKKTYVFGPIVIHIICADIGSKIIITGSFPQIFLTNYSTAKGYNYTFNTLSHALIVDGLENVGLVSAFNGHIQQSDIARSIYKGSWSTSIIENGSYKDFVTNINKFEMSFFLNNGSLFGRHFESLYEYGDVLSSNTLSNDLFGSYNNLVGLFVYGTNEAWNQYNGTFLYAINPLNKVRFSPWRWTPSFFTVAPADPYGMFGGFYYGEYPASEYGFTSNEYGWFQIPLDSARIRFIGCIDSRTTSGNYTYGYGEIVEHVEYSGGTEDPNDLFLFFQSTPLSSIGNDYFYNELVSGSRSSASITIGSELRGFNKTVKISLGPEFQNCSVKLWNFLQYNPNTTLDDAVGIAIENNNHFILYRYAGYLSEVFQTDNFHSYAISNNGQLISVFEGEEFISKIFVFDLYGTKDDTGKYTSGGVSQLRESTIVSSIEALEGAFIDIRAKDYEVVDLDIDSYEINDTPLDVEDEQFSSLSILNFAKDGTSPLTIKKVRCDDGITASYNIGIDECFTSTVVVDDPEQVTATDKLVSKWFVGGGIRGVVRGNFGGTIESPLFEGIGSGSVDTITMPSTFSMFAQTEGLHDIVVFEHALGDIILGECLEETEHGVQISETCISQAACSGEITCTATTSCGQTSEMTYTSDVELSEPILSGEEEPAVNDQYSVSGGVAPYVWSFTGGTIDQTGKITAIISCSGPDGNGGVASVSVTDACGQSDSITVRLPGGSWIYSHSSPETYTTCAGADDFSYNIVEESGNTRLTYRYCEYDGDFIAHCNLDGRPCCLNCSVNDIHPGGDTRTVNVKRVYLNELMIDYWEC